MVYAYCAANAPWPGDETVRTTLKFNTWFNSDCNDCNNIRHSTNKERES
jgi:hypothetical protein